MSDQRILILAGPNGAGKTTFAKQFLMQEADCPTFINADLIAAGLSPFEPERVSIQAGRLMLSNINTAVEDKTSFAIETTLSGIAYAQKIPQWQAMGYRVSLYFLKLDNVDIAIERVAQRVQQGGHNISETVIRRRYNSGWKNFNSVYRSLVNDWILLDNSEDYIKMLEWDEKDE